MVSGVIYILFLPGFCLSFVFFGRSSVDIIERLGLSFALSVAAVPLLAFYLNLAGIKIALGSIILEVASIIITSLGIAVMTGKLTKHKARYHAVTKRH